MATSTEIAKLMVTLGLSTDAFMRGLNQAQNRVKSFAGTLQTAVGVGIGHVMSSGFMMATAAISDGVQHAVKSATDLETAMNVLQQTSGATTTQMTQVSKLSRQLGNDLTLPGVSAADATNAMLELARAGMTVEEAMAASKGALSLAIAAQTNTANAASVVANALNAFHLPASRASQVSDLLAGAANSSSANMTDLADGLKQGAFAFSASGQKLEDLATSLAILTNVGLSGSDAGTALKNALMRLNHPTKEASKLMRRLGFNAFDARGNMKPMRQLVGDLNRALKSMTQQERNAALSTIFLSDGMKAFIPLLDKGVNGYDSMFKAVTRTGQANELAAAQSKGLAGAWDALGSTLETIGTSLMMPFLPYLTEGLNWLSTALSGLPIEEWAQWLTTWLDVAAKEFRWFFDTITDGDPVTLVEYLSDALRRLTGLPVDQWLGGLGWAFVDLTNWIAGAWKVLQTDPTAIFGYFEKGIEHVIAMLIDFGKSTYNALVEFAPVVGDAINKWAPPMIKAVSDLFAFVANLISDAVTPVIANIVAAAPEVAKSVWEWVKASLAALRDAIPVLGSEFRQWVKETSAFLTSSSPQVGASIKTWMTEIGNALKEIAPLVVQIFVALMTEIGKVIMESFPQIAMAIGRATFDAFKTVLVDLPVALAPAFWDAGVALGKAMEEGLGAGFDPMQFLADAASFLVPSGPVNLANAAGVTPEQVIRELAQTIVPAPMPLPAPVPTGGRVQQPGNSVTVNINNPVVDSGERVKQVQRELQTQLDRAILSTRKGIAQ